MRLRLLLLISYKKTKMQGAWNNKQHQREVQATSLQSDRPFGNTGKLYCKESPSLHAGMQLQFPTHLKVLDAFDNGNHWKREWSLLSTSIRLG